MLAQCKLLRADFSRMRHPVCQWYDFQFDETRRFKIFQFIKRNCRLSVQAKRPEHIFWFSLELLASTDASRRSIPVLSRKSWRKRSALCRLFVDRNYSFYAFLQ